ncbi:MAG: cell envelope integrity protein CreD [Parcubacteria group bacterium]|nr:cell envelope integrity protein CreD [Parcubacteria group bacterium]
MQQISGNFKTFSLFSKLIIIALIIGISWASTLFVLGVVNDRSHRAAEAVNEIATKWGREQTVSGPVLTIPVRTPVTTASGERIFQEELVFLLPETLDYDISLDAEVLSRGIFDAGIYTGIIAGSGTFKLNDIDIYQIPGTIQWNKARLSISIPDTRGIDSSATLMWDNEESNFEPGVSGVVLGETGISAPVTVSQFQKTYSFSLALSLRGSEGLNVVPLGKSTTVSVRSNWPSPSFTGEFLPKERKLDEAGFTASWAVSSFGRSFPQSWRGAKEVPNATVAENTQKATFGVALYQDVDFYTQVNRSIKYSILFIALTFLAFFMFEVLAKLRIHPMNYLLVGLAIALFYLLLLSLSENIGFLYAYLASVVAVTGLITAYCRSVLKAKKRAGIIATLLMALYAYLYILLQLDELSLIFGSVFLFIILSAVMYLTRNINWYEISDGR